MKYEFGYCHTFCLVYALVGLSAVSGAGIISKFVCPGDSVQVFGNIAFINCSSVVSLSINGKRNTLIARWSFENCSQNEPLLSDYNDRVFLYGNGTISIHNVHPWDQAKYIVNWQMGDKPMKDEIEIKVMAAPANDCKPVILNLGNSLFASLKSNHCGKPVSTLYWKEYGDVPNTTGPVLTLNPGNQDDTYHACIEGPALTCVRNALDYCSNITIERYKSPPISTDTFDVKIVIYVVVGIVLAIILATAVILIRKHCIKNEFHDRHVLPLLQMDQHRSTDNADNSSGQLIVPLEKEHELWIKHFECLKWEDIKQLLNDEQKQGLKNDCDNSSGQHKVPLEKDHELCTKHFDQTPLLLATHQAAYSTPPQLSHNVSGQQTDPLEQIQELWKYEQLYSLNLEDIKQLSNDQQQEGLDKDKVSGQQTDPLEKIQEKSIKQFECLNFEDIKQLINDQQQEGLDNGCDKVSGQQTDPLEKIQEQPIKQFDNLSGQETDAFEKLKKRLRKQFGNLSRQQKVPSEKHHEKEHFNSLSWEESKAFVNGKQQEGLNNDCDSEDKSKEATYEPSSPCKCRNNERSPENE